jgi:hypothetical protein
MAALSYALEAAVAAASAGEAALASWWQRVANLLGQLGASGQGSSTLSQTASQLATEIQFTQTAARHMSEAGRYVPLNILSEAILTGTRTPDPQGAAGAVRITAPIVVNGVERTLEIIYRASDKTILHFLYR